MPLFLFWLCLSLLAAVTAPGYAQDAGSNSAVAGANDRVDSVHAPRGIGRVVIASGEIAAEGPGGVTRDLKKGDWVYEGDALRTTASSRMQVTFNDGGRLALRPATKLHIDAYHQGDASRTEQVALRLERGGFRTATGRIGLRNHAAYRFSTPQAVIGIRGTDWGAELVGGEDAEDQELHIGVNEGGITVTNDGGSVDLGEGAAFSFAVVETFGSPPTGQSSAPAGLEATLEAAYSSDEGAAPGDDSNDSGDAAEAPGDKSAAEADAGAEAQSEAAAGDASAATGPDDQSTLIELGPAEGEDPEVVFEYSDRCF